MRKNNLFQIPSQGGIIVVVPSFFTLSQSELKHHSVIWVKHWDFHEAVRDDRNYVSDILAKGKITNVVFSTPIIGDAYRKALLYLTSKGVTQIRKVTLEGVRNLIRQFPKLTNERRIEMDQQSPLDLETEPVQSGKLAVFGVNLSAFSKETLDHPNLLLHDNTASRGFRSLPLDTEIKRVVLLQGSLGVSVFSRLRRLFDQEGVQVDVIEGGTKAFKEWILDKDIPTLVKGSVGGTEPHLSNGIVTPKKTKRCYRGGETLVDLIKKFWAETRGGDSQLLLRRIQCIPGKEGTKITSIHSTKSNLLRSGWKPEVSGLDIPKPDEDLEQRARNFLLNLQEAVSLYGELLKKIVDLGIKNDSLVDRNTQLLEENAKLQGIVCAVKEVTGKV